MDFRRSQGQVAQALLNEGDNAIAVHLAPVAPLSPTVPYKYLVARVARARGRHCKQYHHHRSVPKIRTLQEFMYTLPTASTLTFVGCTT
jgi:hypothetical protein